LHASAKQSGEHEAADVTLRRVLLITLALLLSGCATPGPTPTPQSSTGPAQTPLLSIDERNLVSGRLSCGEAESFPVAALDGPGGAELGGDAVSVALRAVLAESGDPQLPRSGWRLVSASLTQATFVARAANESGWAIVALMNAPTGWTEDLAGECRLQPVLAPGLALARWWLDPSANAPSPDATSFVALVHEDCGRPTAGRIPPPAVAYGEAAVTVVFGVVPAVAEGEVDTPCLESPPTPYRVVLTQPLGARQLLDGSAIPPRRPVKPPN
jgi:hypothetical protein